MRIGERIWGGFGSAGGRAREAKAELLAALPLQGLAVLIGGRSVAARIAVGTRAQITWVAVPWIATWWQLRLIASRTAQLSAGWRSVEVPVLAAIISTTALPRSPCGKFGLSRHDIARGLAGSTAADALRGGAGRRRGGHQRYVQRQSDGDAGSLGTAARLRRSRTTDRGLRRHAASWAARPLIASQVG